MSKINILFINNILLFSSNNTSSTNNFLRRLNSDSNRQMDNLLFSNSTSNLQRSSPARTRARNINSSSNNSNTREIHRQFLNNLFNHVVRRDSNSSLQAERDGLVVRSDDINSVRILYDVLRNNIQMSQTNSEEIQLLIDK